jgi:hypothetical protein
MAEMRTLGSLRRFGIWSHPGGRSRQLVNSKKAFSRHEHALAPLPPTPFPSHRWQTTHHREPGSVRIEKKGTLPRLRFKKFESTRASVYRRTASRRAVHWLLSVEMTLGHGAPRRVRRATATAGYMLLCRPGFCSRSAPATRRRRRQHLAVSLGIPRIVAACSVKS